MKVSNCEIEIFYKIMSNKFNSFLMTIFVATRIKFFEFVTKFDLMIFMLSRRGVDFAAFVLLARDDRAWAFRVVFVESTNVQRCALGSLVVKA